MGRFCRICHRVRANEKFSGQGHRRHIGRDCLRRPRNERDRIERLDEIRGFLRQSVVPEKNIARLSALCGHGSPDVARLAGVVLDVARAFPGKRNRWVKLATRHRAIFDRALEALGIEFFEDFLSGSGDFESPLWRILDDCRASADQKKSGACVPSL